MADTKPIDIIRAQNAVGEAIIWDARRRVLWWTDIPAQRLHHLAWHTGITRVLQTPERVASMGLVAGSERLITAFASRIALFDPESGDAQWIAQPEPHTPGVRFNDGRVDRLGRFWVGTMVEDDSDAAKANVYSVAAQGQVRRQLSGVRISNGLCNSPDGKYLYFADSPTRTIWEFELLEPEGRLGEPRLFARTPRGAFPDGAAIDSDGCLWSAHWGNGQVVRYTPEGVIDRVLVLPVSQPSCVCFGGDGLDLLFVTSARRELSQAALLGEPHAGDVLVYRPGVTGLPECEYRP